MLQLEFLVCILEHGDDCEKVFGKGASTLWGKEIYDMCTFVKVKKADTFVCEGGEDFLEDRHGARQAIQWIYFSA